MKENIRWRKKFKKRGMSPIENGQRPKLAAWIVAYGYKGDRVDPHTALGIGAFNNRLGPFSVAASPALEKKLKLKPGQLLVLTFGNGREMVAQFDDRMPAASAMKLMKKHGRAARYALDIYLPWADKKIAYAVPPVAKLEVIKEAIDPQKLEQSLIKKGKAVFERAKPAQQNCPSQSSPLLSLQRSLSESLGCESSKVGLFHCRGWRIKGKEGRSTHR